MEGVSTKKGRKMKTSTVNEGSSLSDTRSFNKLIQEAVEQSGEEFRTGKKKRNVKKDENLLNMLKKGEGLVKDEADTTLLANVYDPDNDSKGKNNKRLQKEREKKKNTEKGMDNMAFEEETDKPKKQKKKQNTEQIEDVMQTSKEEVCDSIESLDKNETSAEQKVVRKKKKKKKVIEIEENKDIEAATSKPTEEEQEVKEETKEAEETEGVDNKESKEETKVRIRKKKKKKAKEDKAEEEKPRVIEDDGRIIGVQIHRTDKLKTDFYMSHPLVRVSFVDMATGQYLKKQTSGRPVASFYEQENERVDFFQPIMTLPFDFKEKKSTLPVWEEMVVFNENFNYILTDSPQVILFFELLDFLSMNTTKHRYNAQKKDGGWHRIAWGFLKVQGASGLTNTDKKVRLQLYQPVRLRAKPDQLEIFQWYKHVGKTPYPSTLYVTLKGFHPSSNMDAATRSMFATQREQGGRTFDDLQYTLTQTLKRANIGRREASAWTRLPGQVCKIPNESCLTLSGGRKGCSFISFSPNGHYLACGCKENETYPVIVYEIPGGRVKCQFPGHYGIIYELCWSSDNKDILSASSDGTVKIWDMQQHGASPEKILPHPSFVYSAKFHNRISKVVVTGGYDRTIRVWSTLSDDDHAMLMQELDGHLSHVNSICFDSEGSRMFSGDGLGHIIVWNAYVTDQPSKRGILKDWTKNKDIKIGEMLGVAINCLKVLPNNRRLLMHARDNTIRLLDLRIDVVMQRYQGALNYREKICGTVTPCGTFIITGSEDCNLYVWNADTGDQVAMFADLKYNTPVICVDYHPLDHMMALCAFGDNEPIIVYRYSHEVAKMEAGLVDMTQRKTGQPGAPHLWNVVEQAVNQKLEMVRNKTSHLAEDLRARTLTRMDRVKKKLDSVTPFQSMVTGTHPARDHPLGIPGTCTTNASGVRTTWGTTFDTFDTSYYSQLERTSSPPPGVFSPHASSNPMLQSMHHQQQMSSQAGYLKQTSDTWRPMFSTVGRPRSTLLGAKQPSLLFNPDMEGKPHFQFQTPDGETRTTGEKVVALYDYAAQRSDELSMQCGDVILVLHKDNANWWMGQLPSGQQGFFPANYVATEGENDEDTHDPDETDQDAEIPSGASSPTGKVTTHAVTTKSGQLKFFSGTEDSDVDNTPKKRRKPKNQKGGNLTFENEMKEFQSKPKKKNKSEVKTEESEA